MRLALRRPGGLQSSDRRHPTAEHRKVSGCPMSARLRVNPVMCEAHGMCAELLPELIRLDDWGYPNSPSSSAWLARPRTRPNYLALLLDEDRRRCAAGGVRHASGDADRLTGGPMVICERCGTESPIGFHFLRKLRAPLTTAPPTSGARKVVTALFCDIVGSTALGETLDPELLENVIHGYFDAMRETIEGHGGTRARSSPATRYWRSSACRRSARMMRCALSVPRSTSPSGCRRMAEQVGVELRCRTGINTGLVVSGRGPHARPRRSGQRRGAPGAGGPAGGGVIGEDTLRLVRHAVEVERSGRRSPQGEVGTRAAFRATLGRSHHRAWPGSSTWRLSIAGASSACPPGLGGDGRRARLQPVHPGRWGRRRKVRG